MKIFFLTAKKGNFHETEYHIYEFLNHLKMYFKAAKRFVRKLRSEEELVFHFDSNYLYTFRALPASKTRFLKRVNHNSQKPDISNIQLTTSFINQLIHEALDGEFPLAPFNKGHILDTREAEGMIFNLLAHCDAELFNSGDLYVFFSLHATAELAQDIIADKIRMIQDEILPERPECKEIMLTIRSYDRKKNTQICLGSESLLDFINSLDSRKPFKITMRQDDMYRLYPNILPEWMDFSKHSLSRAIRILTPVSNRLNACTGLNFSSKPFYRFEAGSFFNNKNLLTGSNMSFKQAAIYYNGFYKPVKNACIQIINFSNSPPDQVISLIRDHFNKNGSVDFLPVVDHKMLDSSFETESIKSTLNSYKNHLIILYTRTIIEEALLKKISRISSRIEISPKSRDNYSLSNFAVKCISRLGGIPYALHTLRAEKHCYFLGLDLGHQTGKFRPRKSNIAFAFFDYTGVLLHKKVYRDELLNEVIAKNIYKRIFNELLEFITDRKLPEMKKLILHRDGRFSALELIYVAKIIESQKGIEDYDLVEIIKRGQPYMGAYEDTKYQSVLSGTFWQLKEEDYALLLTNPQQSIANEVQRPITVRRKKGSTPFSDILWQVYWLCYPYSNQLYYPARVPCTIGIPNRIAATGKKGRSYQRPEKNLPDSFSTNLVKTYFFRFFS